MYFELLTNLRHYFNTLTFLFIVNVVISIIVLIYSFYLYKLEKRYNEKLDSIDDLSSEIIKEANKKALEILKNSQYLSENLKKEIEDNFDVLLETLTNESKDLYRQIEKAYYDTAQKFTKEVEKKAEEEITTISQQLVHDTQDAEKQIKEMYEKEYANALEEIKKYKEEQKEVFRQEMEAKIMQVIRELIPQNITIEDHNKIVNEALEKAYKDKVFT